MRARTKIAGKSLALSGRTDGFTLIESLIALLVLSIGMLGMAALYVESLKAGRSSFYRTLAVDLTADLADRIRANPTVPAAYNVGGGDGANNNCVNAVADCTAAQMAADDIFRWRREVLPRLPAGTVTNVAVNAATTPATYFIGVQWPEAGQDEPVVFSLTVQM